MRTSTSTAITLALIASLGFGSIAQAQDWQRGNHRDDGDRRGEWQQRDEHRGDQRDHRGEWRQRQISPAEQWQRQIPGQQYNVPQWQGRSWDGRAYNRSPEYVARPYAYNAPRPYWRGGYLPNQYRSQRYWVNDWRARHLAPPPYGYQWVQTDTGDLLLVALATGLIANLILAQ